MRTSKLKKWAWCGSLLAVLATCTALAVVSSTEPTKETDLAPLPESVPGQYVVQLAKPRSAFETQVLESKLGGKILSEIRPDMVLLQRKVGERPDEVIRVLRSRPEVLIAEPNYIFRIQQRPNDPEYEKLWGLANFGQKDGDNQVGVPGIDMNMERAWEITTGSRDVIVAVIDTGVNYRHPDLAANMWVNEAELNGEPGVDDDGNGYIDDIYGYNFVKNNGDPMDDNGHGTHCAGTIGAEGNNGIGVAGVAWKVRIMALKFLDAAGGGTLDNAIRALDYATKSNAMILSNSWGGSINSELLEKAVYATRDAGKLFVAAAGNNGMNNDKANSVPANYNSDNIISVAAIDNRGMLARFSNYGATKVHIAAPGVGVYSTYKNGYLSLSGTSMATPHVSGLAALLLAQNPTWTYKEVKERILNSARPLAQLRGRIATGGIADAYYALTGQTPPPDPNDPTDWENRVPYSLSTDHPYANDMDVTYTITIPGAKRLAVHFSRFETEAGYDKVEFLDPEGKSYGTLSGNYDNGFSPVINGDTVLMRFKTDRSVTKYGFDVDFIAVEN